MNIFKLQRNQQGDILHIETHLSGPALLNTAQLNKGCAFSASERLELNLTALLPMEIETLEQQVKRMYAQYQAHPNNLGKNIYLNMLHDYNQTLFYRLVSDHLEEMLPVIYTPTVGEAAARFSIEHRRPRGLYINYTERDKIDKIIDRYLSTNTNLIVVTDGEAVLGIGDQGIGGINIASSKLMVYTLCAGLNPHSMIPIQLDVGTNNPQLLNDPTYLGWRHERITGTNYDDFIDTFVQAILKKTSHALLHWEDFGRDNARNILEKYKTSCLTINGDIQSTGTVALASILAGVKSLGSSLADQRIVIFGAGTAGIGIADEIVRTMQNLSISEKEARSKFWLIDKAGLLTNQTPMLLTNQRLYARPAEEITSWQLSNPNYIGLEEVVRYIKPTILIGASAVGNAFNETIVKLMAQNTTYPIIMPLSNPTAKSEATPENLLRWTKGKALIATGGPFPDIHFNGRLIHVAQCNNLFTFPGIGLGVIAANAKYLTDEMLRVAGVALSECAPILKDKTASLLPTIAETKKISLHIAEAVIQEAKNSGLAEVTGNFSIQRMINQVSWAPVYYPYKKVG